MKTYPTTFDDGRMPKLADFMPRWAAATERSGAVMRAKSSRAAAAMTRSLWYCEARSGVDARGSVGDDEGGAPLLCR